MALGTAVKGFVKDIETLTAANGGQLAAAGQGIPADEKRAVTAFSESGQAGASTPTRSRAAIGRQTLTPLRAATAEAQIA